jgi:hypothetical protein
MAVYKSLVVPARWVEAGRSRKCYHSPKHEVCKGDRVLEVKVKLAWYGYCEACAKEMLRSAISELTTLRASVGSTRP